MQDNPPRLARITSFEVEYINPLYEADFSIVTSRVHGNKEADISPDVAVCKDCINDIFDKNNRLAVPLSFYQLHELRPKVHYNKR